MWYQLASGDQPDPGRNASGGQIQVYDQETTQTALLNLGGMGPDPNPLSPGPHVVQATFPSPQEPSHVHLLVCPKDNDSDHDKGQRMRWALQHNQLGGKGATVAFDYGGTDFYSTIGTQQPIKAGQASWMPGMKAMGYHNLIGDWATTFYNRIVWPISLAPTRNAIFGVDQALVDYEWCEYNANSERISNALQWTDKAGNKPLEALLIVGHGGPDGSRVCVRGTDVNDPKPGMNDQTYIVSALTAAEIAAHPAMVNQDELVLTGLRAGGMNLNGVIVPSSPRPFANLKLVVIAACDAGVAQPPAGITTLQDEFLALGAQCVVTIGEDQQDVQGFDSYLQAFLKGLGANETVEQANNEGNTQAIADHHATGNMGGWKGNGNVKL